MASLWQHPNSPFWTACFSDKDGRRRKLSTKETNRKKALKIAEAFEEAARKRRTFTQVRGIIQDLHEQITGEELKVVTFRDHVENWLSEKQDETKPSTMHFYRSTASKFLAFLADRAGNDIAEITRQDVVAYRRTLSDGLSSVSVNQHLKCLRMVFKTARREGMIAENPAEFVETVRQKGGYERRPFTVLELQAILREADPEWRSMILFGIYTGQRLSDIASLTWANVDLQAGEIRLTAAKTGKRLILPIAPPLFRHLESMPSSDTPGGALHPRALTALGKAYRTSTLSNQFANILAAVGLRPKLSHRKEKGGRNSMRDGTNVSFHCLRHTAVTLLKEAGVPMAVVMELIGHDSAQMSEHYTHVGKEAMEKAANSMPDFSRHSTED